MTLADHPPATAPPTATYGAVLGSRHVARLLAGTLTGRLPNSMVPVGLVLWITGGGGSLAFAGMLAALYGLASGLSQPVKGRLMDRHGQARVSAPAVLLNAGCLAALPLIGAGGQPTVVTAVVGFAGLVTPPLEAGLRALWPTVLPDLGRRRVVQALDTGSQGLLYIVGPLLASWLATAHGPDTALTTTAALGLVGTAVVLTAAPSQTWRPPAADGAAGRGRLMSAGLIQLFTALAGTGFAFGAMNVWAAGMAGTHGLAMFSGVLPAAFSTGSFLGSLIYARRARPGPPATQLITTSALFLLGWMPLLTQPGPRTAIVFTAVPGLFYTLIITNGFHTVDVLAPPSRTTEAYAWLILSVGTGQAAGTALAAALATRLYVLAALPAAGAATALTILALARRDLGTTSPRGRHRRPRQHPNHGNHGNHRSNLPPHERDTYVPVVGSPGHQAVRNGAPAYASAAAQEEWLAATRGQEQRAARARAEWFGKSPLEGTRAQAGPQWRPPARMGPRAAAQDASGGPSPSGTSGQQLRTP
ncbi:Major Facilitator Superfamily protein [Streptomyces sp. ADI95-16]|uniref:MFS transporter n=1 Tax=Streptomyces sp. ADI95-16 TaxID=1522758 RepID=UPI000F435159|nr:MFS transporter [Streptomyces sp. ADI95-16]AYV32000.1 Major Facilitator Superfamily protein [Streptomyces sp. ADI95-16]